MDSQLRAVLDGLRENPDTLCPMDRASKLVQDILGPPTVPVELLAAASRLALRYAAKPQPKRQPFSGKAPEPWKPAVERKTPSDGAVKIEYPSGVLGGHEPPKTNPLLDGFDLSGTLPNGWKLFEHQQDGISWMLSYKDRNSELTGCILADDMGLGKTLQACVAASRFGLKVYIMAPPATHRDWLKTAKVFGLDVAISSHHFSKIPVPPEIESFIIIVDEAHAFQNPKSKRTKAFMGLPKRATAAYLLTGTPVKNGQPRNLWPLLAAINHPIALNQYQYEKRYCAAGPKKVGRDRWVKWDTSGASNLEELHRLIRDCCLRRRKQDCLDLPQKVRQAKYVNLSAAAKKAYAEAFARLRREFEQRKQDRINDFNARVARLNDRRLSAEDLDDINESDLKQWARPLRKLRRDIARAIRWLDATPHMDRWPLAEVLFEPISGTDAASASDIMNLRIQLVAELSNHLVEYWQARLENMDLADPMVMLGQLIQAASVAKIDGTVEIVEEIVEQGHAAVIFTRFVDVGRRIAEALGCDHLHGATAKSARDEMIDRLQSGEKKALVVGFGAGGVGITLTAADHVILVDRPWTPGDAIQAEDRIHRIGQTRASFAFWLQCPGANDADAQVDAILIDKAKRAGIIIDGEETLLEGIEAKSGSLRQVALQLFS